MDVREGKLHLDGDNRYNFDFPGGSDGKASAYNARDLGLIPGLGRSPGEGNSYPLQYPDLQNSTDGMVHGGQTRLSDFHLL